jgi:hypothetical protein
VQQDDNVRGSITAQEENQLRLNKEKEKAGGVVQY